MGDGLGSASLVSRVRGLARRDRAGGRGGDLAGPPRPHAAAGRDPDRAARGDGLARRAVCGARRRPRQRHARHPAVATSSTGARPRRLPTTCRRPTSPRCPTATTCSACGRRTARSTSRPCRETWASPSTPRRRGPSCRRPRSATSCTTPSPCAAAWTTRASSTTRSRPGRRARRRGTRCFIATAVPAGTDTLYRWNTRSVLDGVWELRVGVLDSLGLVGYVQVTVTIDNLAPGASVTSPARVDHVKGGRVYHDVRRGRARRAAERVQRGPDRARSIRFRRRSCRRARTLPGRRGVGWIAASRARMTLAKPATLIVQTPGVPAGVPVALYRIVVDRNGHDATCRVGRRALVGRALAVDDDLAASARLPCSRAARPRGADFKGARGLDCQPRVRVAERRRVRHAARDLVRPRARGERAR